jgi:preprotein translocase subunit YajC
VALPKRTVSTGERALVISKGLGLLLLQTASTGNPILGFLPLILIFGIFYFLLFLPMQRQRKKQQRMLQDLKNGDIVTTSGGIVGSIVSLSDDSVVLRVKPDNVKLQFARSAVSGTLAEPDESKK